MSAFDCQKYAVYQHKEQVEAKNKKNISFARERFRSHKNCTLLTEICNTVPLRVLSMPIGDILNVIN